MHDDPVRIGIYAGQVGTSYRDYAELWRRAEDLGYDWFALFDHLRPAAGLACLEATTLAAALAARTSRIRCAVLVLAVGYRHPALVASMAATIDHISGGRFELGLGAGGPDLATAEYGLGFPGAGTRLDMLDEACQVVRRLWQGGPADFEGDHYRLAGAVLDPVPVQEHLPLIVGGSGPRLLGVAARHADIWNTFAGDPAAYREMTDTLARHCAAAGRDPATIRRSLVFRAVLGGSEAEARRRAGEQASAAIAGTADQLVAALAEYAALGVRDFVLAARAPYDWETIERVAAAAPALRDLGS